MQIQILQILWVSSGQIALLPSLQSHGFKKAQYCCLFHILERATGWHTLTDVRPFKSRYHKSKFTHLHKLNISKFAWANKGPRCLASVLANQELNHILCWSCLLESISISFLSPLTGTSPTYPLVGGTIPSTAMVTCLIRCLTSSPTSMGEAGRRSVLTSASRC